MSILHIRGGRILDPSRDFDGVADLWIENGRIIDRPSGTSAKTIDATGCLVTPGFVDLHASFREPGSEEDETIATGSAAALAGGFTTVAVLPDSDPPVDHRAAAEFVIRQGERARQARVLPLGTVTQGRKGDDLAEMGQLVDGGAVGFSDGKRSINSAEVMRRGLQYASMFSRPVLHHPIVPELVSGGVMHEGYHSVVFGLRGMPTAAEEIMVRRDIALAELTGGHVHLMCISSQGSVEEIRQAKRAGIRVTADVSPHHLLLTDESLREYDPNYKVDPPLRPQTHIDGLIAGIKDGTIEAIASDHQPHAQEKKECEVDLAPFGISSLETVLPVCVEALITPGHATWLELIRLLTVGPATILNIESCGLSAGCKADVTIIDPGAKWTVKASAFRSRSRNTPFDGRTLTGLVRHTIVGGEPRYSSVE
jgi:dihydroorotase